MSTTISSEAGACRCHRCGRVIGSYENGNMVIRHKGRTVRVKPLDGACEVQIVCEKPNCHATNIVVLADLQGKVVESLDKTGVSRT